MESTNSIMINAAGIIILYISITTHSCTSDLDNTVCPLIYARAVVP